MKKKLLLIICTVFMVLTNPTTYGQINEITRTIDHPNHYRLTLRWNTGTIDCSEGASSATFISYTGPGGHLILEDQNRSGCPGGMPMYIENVVFANKGLTGVELPNELRSIGSRAFEDNDMTSVTIPNSVTSIGDNAFRNNQLTEVTIPNSVTDIGEGAFSDNDLTEVTIGRNVRNIHPWAFAGNQLNKVVVEAEDPPSLVAPTIAHGKRSHFTSRSKIVVVVPPGKAQEYLDNGWTGFKAVTDRDVGDEFIAFTGGGASTRALFEITSLNPRTVTLVEYVGDSYNSGLETDAIIPSSVVGYSITRIGDNAFQDKGLTSVVLPNSVTHIGNEAFRDNNLTSVDIPNGMTRIGIGAFHDNNLARVTLPNSVTYIGPNAFSGNQLTEVTLPNRVSLIGNWAFLDNPNLARVVSGAEVPSTIGERTFENADRDEIDLVVPKGAKTAYENPANGWTGFRSVTEEVVIDDTFTVNGIEYQVTALGSTNTVMVVGYTGPATNVTILRTVIHQETSFEVTRIGAMAFRDNNLASVGIPNSITRIGAGAFFNNELTSVTLPESVTYIGGHAFDGNQLTEVILPGSVETIGFWAFFNNPNLATVVTGSVAPPTIGENSFTNADRDEIDLVVPPGTRQEYLDNGWTGFKSITEQAGTGGNFTIDGIRYEVTALGSTNTVTIVDYTGSATNVTIPGTITYQEISFEVTSIEESAFRENALTSVGIPNSVTSIGNNAFRDNQLSSVIIPSSVTTISAAAFMDNQLASVTIPNSVTSIGAHAFHNNQLTEVTLPDDVTSMGNDAFRNNQLTSVEIPNGVTRIEDSTFRGNALTSVTLPSNVTSIGTSAFGGGNPLTSVRLRTDTPPSLGINTFGNRAQIDVIVPNGAKAAYEDPASGWTDFNSIVVADFTSNGLDYRRTSLNPATVEVTGRAGNSTNTDITIPGTVSDGSNNFEVTAIGDSAFRDNQLTSVTISDGVTSIGGHAFRDNQLTSVEVPNSVTHIGWGAFRENLLTRVAIGRNVTNIGVTAFQDNNLTSVALPESVTDIAYEAFKNNPGLATVVLKGATPPSINANAFRRADREEIDLSVPAGRRQAYLDNGWTGFKSITETFTVNGIEYQVTALGSPGTVTIVNYTGLATSVTIPSTVTYEGSNFGVTAIGVNAFRDKQLTSIIIPNSVTSIGNDAFAINNLTEVALPDSVTSIGRAAFERNQLTGVAIPNSVASIEPYAFYLNQLTSVTIPNSVTSIGLWAFRDNPNLSLVIVEASTPPSFSANPFLNANRDQIDVIVPNGAKADYEDPANGWTGFNSITELVGTGDNFTVDGIEYQVTALGSSSTVTIVNYTGSATSVTIPQTVDHGPNTYTVTAIGGGEAESQQPFRQKGLTSVIIPNTVTSIGIGAFNRNDLTEVTLPDGITNIPKWAFAQNDIRELTLPASVDNIGEQAFFSNRNLSMVTMEANHPPTLHVTAFQGGNTDLRAQIDVIVPNGAKATYENPANGWTGFSSITEEVAVGVTFTVDDIIYQVSSANTVTAIDYNTAGGPTVTIPQKVQYQGVDYSVTAIGNEAFLNKGLTGVTIGQNVTSIGLNAFQDNALTTVEIPHPVTHIGDFAFANNQLTEVIMHKNGLLEVIERNAFRDNQLSSVDIPDAVTTIGTFAFRDNQLNSVTLGANVARIGEAAFSRNQLTRVTLPSTVTTIEARAFDENSGFSLVTVEAADPPTLDADAFQDPGRDQIDLVVPSGAKAAYEDPANGWTGFESVTEVAEIGGTFIADHITYQITALAPSFEVTATGYNTAGGTLVTIPSTVVHGNTYEVTAIGNEAFEDNGLTHVVIPEGVTHIGISAFADNRDMDGPVIPSTVTSIGHSAFWNCGLSSLEIPEGITDIGDNTFGRNNLTSVTIPAGVTSIGGSAFMTLPGSPSKMTELIMLGSAPPTLQNSSFTTRGEIDVTVPAGALAGYQAREGSDWNGFKSITEPVDVGVGDSFTVDGIEYRITALGSTNTVTTVDYTGSATSVTIPGEVSYGPHNFEVTGIGNDAFRDNQLASVTLPNTVTSIGNDAFRDNQLTSVEIPEGVASIGIRAFTDNRNMGSLVIPSSVTSIGNSAFWNCGLSSLQIPEGITDIGDNTFGRNNLTSVTIPAGVTSIGGSAFMTLPGSPSKMTELIMLGSAPPTLQNSSFTTRGEIDVTVPAGALANYQAREGSDWNGFKSITEPVDVGVGDSFTVNGIVYQVTAQGSTNTVTIVNYIGSATSVTIPQTVSHGPNTYTVTAIGGGEATSQQPFYNKGLTSVIIPNTVTSIGIGAFNRNDLTEVTLPDGITNIPKWAFAQNDIRELTLPASVDNIGEQAFFSNRNLSMVTMEANHPPTLHVTAFQGGNTDLRAQIDVIVPNGTKAAYENPANGWTGFSSITEPVDVGVGDSFTVNGIVYQVTAQGSTNTVTIVNYIGSATSVTIPQTVNHDNTAYDVTAIGIEAFEDKGLTHVVIPEGVTHIGSRAFADNRDMDGPVIPSSVTSIGHSAFWNCGLSSLQIPEGITDIGDNTFGRNNLTSVTIPAGVTSIGGSAFMTLPGSPSKMTELIMLGSAPPTLQNSSFTTRGEIDVTVPASALANYQAREGSDWNGFKSIRGDTGADNEAPTAVLAPITLALDENGRATLLAAQLDNGSTDNRTVAEDLRFSFDADGNETDRVFDCSDLGDHQVTVHVTDEDENSATATAVVTVVGANALPVAPTISSNGPICAGGNAIFTFTGTPGDRVTYSGALSGEVIIEANGTATVTVSGASSDTTLNVTGATNGSCSVPFSETATVTIQDFSLTAIARDITVQLDANGEATISPGQVDDGSNYGCGNTPSLGLDRDTFDCNDVGSPVTVTLTAAQDGQTATATAQVTVLNPDLGGNGCDIIASDALRVLVMTPSCTGSADGSVAVIMDDPGYRMDISIGGGTMGDRFFNDIPSGANFEIDGLGVGNYTVTVTVPELSLERTFGATVNGMGTVSGKRGSLDRKEGRATYVVSGSDRYEVSVNGGKMDFAFGDTGPQSIQLENLYGRTEVVISGRNGCQGKVTDSFFMDSVLAEVYPTATSSFITILTQGGHLDVQVHTLSGRLVKGARFTERENIMDLSFLESGMYILKMAFKGKEQTIKIMKR